MVKTKLTDATESYINFLLSQDHPLFPERHKELIELIREIYGDIPHIRVNTTN